MNNHYYYYYYYSIYFLQLLFHNLSITKKNLNKILNNIFWFVSVCHYRNKCMCICDILWSLKYILLPTLQQNIIYVCYSLHIIGFRKGCLSTLLHICSGCMNFNSSQIIWIDSTVYPANFNNCKMDKTKFAVLLIKDMHIENNDYTWEVLTFWIKKKKNSQQIFFLYKTWKILHFYIQQGKKQIF